MSETPPSDQAPPPSQDAPPPSASAPPPTEQAPPPSAQAPPLSQGPQDADDTRSYHFRRYVRKPVSLSLGSTFAIVAFVAGTVAAGPAIGAGAAVAVLLIALLIAYLLAASKAEDDFFRAYAQARGLIWSDQREQLPGVTPLLRKGDDRYSQNTLRGKVADGLDGVLSLYTYEEESTDSKGNRQTSYYHFTLVMADLPEASPKVSKLYCNRRSGFRFLEGVEDAFRRNKRVELESEALADEYEIFAGPDEDDNWLRQLFSPSFIVWLTEAAPDALAFELESGVLCVNVKKHRKKAAELDGICQTAAHVAKRIRDEAVE